MNLKIIKLKERLNPWTQSFSFEMTDGEKLTFNSYIIKSKNYLEFGSGGSTFHVLKNSNAKVHSVESSPVWMRHMRTYIFIRINQLFGRLNFYPINIGKTRGWGFPAEKNLSHLYPNYSSDIFTKVDPSIIDTVLVDGRFRVACALNTLIHCYKNKGLRIIIHDFWNREKYFKLLDYLDVEKRVDSLAGFRPKKIIDIELLKADYEVYKFNPH